MKKTCLLFNSIFVLCLLWLNGCSDEKEILSYPDRVEPWFDGSLYPSVSPIKDGEGFAIAVRGSEMLKDETFGDFYVLDSTDNRIPYVLMGPVGDEALALSRVVVLSHLETRKYFLFVDDAKRVETIRISVAGRGDPVYLYHVGDKLGEEVSLIFPPGELKYQ